MTHHLISVPIKMKAFHKWSAARGLMGDNNFSEDYALHVLLSGAFGKSVLQPFRLMSTFKNPKGTLYGYAKCSAKKLRTLIEEVATPDCLGVIKHKELKSKPMNMTFKEGKRLGFDLRVRPVVRKHDEGRPSKRFEIDAFLAQEKRSPAKNPTEICQLRQSVYTDWLSHRFNGAADIKRCDLTRFRITPTVRGNNKTPNGPDAILQGDIVVRNADSFYDILCHGIGRHKAYGFGMLILRPPG